jgi:hypothetical protein
VRRVRLWLRRGLVLGGLLVGLLLFTGGSASAFPPFDDCKSPPVPAMINSGLAGSIDDVAAGNPPGANATQDPYVLYSYGGLFWSTYDLGCAGSVSDPGATVDTTIGNFLLGTAKTLFAAQVTLKTLAEYPNSANVGPSLADAAKKSTPVVYDVIFSPWAGAAIVVAATGMLIATRRGNIGAVATRAAMILVAVTITALSFGSGAQLSSDLKEGVQSAVFSATDQLAEKGFPASADTYKSNVHGYSDPMRSAMFDKLIYDGWTAGEVGSSGPPDLARKIAAAQSVNVDEYLQATGGETPGPASPDTGANLRNLYAAKGQAWEDAFNSAPPQVQENMRGRGESRVGAGLGVLIKMLPVTLLQIFGSMVMLIMMVFLTLLPVGAPVVGLLSLVAPSTPERMIKIIGAIMGGGIAAAICISIHTLIVLYLLAGDGATGFVPAIFMWVASLILYRLLKPLTSIVGIVSAVTASHTRVASRLAGSPLRSGMRISRWIKSEHRYRETRDVAARRHGELIDVLRGGAAPVRWRRPGGPPPAGGGRPGPTGGPNGGGPGPAPGPGGGPGPSGGGPLPAGPRGGPRSGGPRDGGGSARASGGGTRPLPTVLTDGLSSGKGRRRDIGGPDEHPARGSLSAGPSLGDMGPGVHERPDMRSAASRATHPALFPPAHRQTGMYRARRRPRAAATEPTSSSTRPAGRPGVRG